MASWLQRSCAPVSSMHKIALVGTHFPLRLPFIHPIAQISGARFLILIAGGSWIRKHGWRMRGLLSIVMAEAEVGQGETVSILAHRLLVFARRSCVHFPTLERLCSRRKLFVTDEGRLRDYDCILNPSEPSGPATNY